MTNVPTAPIHYGLQTGNLILQGRPKGLRENPAAYRRTSVSRLRAKGDMMTRRIVDLGLRLTEGLKTWDVKPPFTMLPCMNAATFRLGFSTKLLILEDHCGTHVDSPYHFYDGEFRTPQGRTIDEIPIEKFMGEAVLIDVSFKAPKDPVDRALLEAAARDQGIRLMRGDILLVRTWAREWGEPMAEFLQARAFTLDACEWLLGQGVKLVGLDLPNLEGALSEDYGNMDAPGHVLLLHPTHEVLIVENLVNLDQIRAKRFEFYALPLHIKGATGSPVRAVAVEQA
jgi:arylformamidase